MAEVDIDSLLNDIDSALETSPQHQQKKNLVPSSQENLHPQSSTAQNTVASHLSFNDDAVDDNSLDKLLELLPIVDTVDSGDGIGGKSDAPHSPVCPLKRRPLKESNAPLMASAVHGDCSPPASKSDSESGGGNESVQFKHNSPRPPPPQKRTGNTPTSQHDPINSSNGVTDFDSMILDGGDVATPPASPVPVDVAVAVAERGGIRSIKSASNLVLEGIDDGEIEICTGGGEGAAAGVDVSDFDIGDESPRSNTLSRPVSACSPVVMAAAVADGTIPSLDPDGLSEELATLLGPSEPTVDASSSSSSTDQAKGKLFTALPIAASVGEHQKKARCIKCTLNGPSATRGHKQSSFARDVVCGNLRCLKCNFSVRTYPNAAWETSVDYMFFRNSFPDDAKLGNMLVTAEGCAYCCQCSWTVATEELEVKDLGLQWSCSGHVGE